MSDHYLVEAKLMRRGVEVIRAGELGKQGSKRRFKEKINEKWSIVEGREVGRVEEKWVVFKDDRYVEQEIWDWTGE